MRNKALRDLIDSAAELERQATAPLHRTYLDRHGDRKPLPGLCGQRRIYNVRGIAYQVSLFKASPGSCPYIEVRDLDRPESSLIVRLLSDTDERDAGLVKYHRLSGHPPCVRAAVEFFAHEFRRYITVQ